jgi:hypothetical protein
MPSPSKNDGRPNVLLGLTSTVGEAVCPPKRYHTAYCVISGLHSCTAQSEVWASALACEWFSLHSSRASFYTLRLANAHLSNILALSRARGGIQAGHLHPRPRFRLPVLLRDSAIGMTGLWRPRATAGIPNTNGYFPARGKVFGRSAWYSAPRDRLAASNTTMTRHSPHLLAFNMLRFIKGCLFPSTQYPSLLLDHWHLETFTTPALARVKAETR